MKKLILGLLLLLSPLLHAQTAGMQARLYYASTAGSVNVMTLTQAGATLTAGQWVIFTPNLANTTTTPTLNVNGLGAKTITRNGASPLAVGDLVTTAIAYCIYDGTQWELLNPQTVFVPSNGTNPGSISLPGNTTAPTLPTSTFSLIGPNSASFTAYGWQLPATPNTAAQIPLLGTPSGGITPITYSGVWHLVQAPTSLSAQSANITTTTLYTTPAANGFYRMCLTATETRAATTSSSLVVPQGLYTGANDSVPFKAFGPSGGTNTSNSTTAVSTGCSGVLYVLASTAISYNTVGYASSGATTMQYDLQITLEALQ